MPRRPWPSCWRPRRAQLLATFDSDVLFDYRARRPTLEILDGRTADADLARLTLPSGAAGRSRPLDPERREPDFRWQEFCDAILDSPTGFGVAQWISLGAIPAAVPHTRPVTIIGTESSPGLLRGEVQPGPTGLLRVPSAAISVLDIMMAQTGIPTLGYFAQVPHYVTAPYPVAVAGPPAARCRATSGPSRRPSALDERRGSCAPAWTPATGADDDTRRTSRSWRRWSTSRACRRATS